MHIELEKDDKSLEVLRRNVRKIAEFLANETNGVTNLRGYDYRHMPMITDFILASSRLCSVKKHELVESSATHLHSLCNKFAETVNSVEKETLESVEKITPKFTEAINEYTSTKREPTFAEKYMAK